MRRSLLIVLVVLIAAYATVRLLYSRFVFVRNETSDVRADISALRAALLDSDANKRIDAARELASLDPESRVECLRLLIAALDNPDESVRAHAAAALGDIGHQARD